MNPYRKILSSILREYYEVVTFNNVKDTISFLQTNANVSYIISDYMIENSTGLNILDFIIKNNYFDNYEKHFLFITAYDDVEINFKIKSTACRKISKVDLSPTLIKEIIES